MKYYAKNIFRTVLQNRSSYIGAVVIISIGIMIFVAMMEFLNNLDNALEYYCQKNAFADVFASVKSMPGSKVDDLLEVEGVEEAFGRLEGEARLLQEDGTEIITLYMMAWSPEDTMNQITLRPEPEKLAEDEIYVGVNMVKALGLQDGDQLTLVANARTRRFTFRGSAYSPEMMYVLADEATPAPDNAIYDFGAAGTGALETLLGKRGMVTSIGLRLSPGYTFEEVRPALEKKLAPYGMTELYGRKDQVSYDAFKDEIESYETIIALLPTIFMLVTMFILYIILKKMVDKDRTLIGTLKAFGATNWEIVSRYLVQGVIIGLAGGLLPILPAELAGQYLYVDDAVYYAMPYINYRPDPAVWAMGLLISLGTSLTALMLGIRDVLYIMPAESMRAAAPAGTFSFELPAALEGLLNQRQRIGLRAIFRNLLRSVIIALSIALPFGMISAFGSFNDVLNQTMYDQFLKAETYELRVRLTDYVSEETAQSMLRKVDGIGEADTASSYSVELICRNRRESATLSVMKTGSTMSRIMDVENRFFEPRDDGLILSEGFARKLNVKEGELIEVKGGDLTRGDQTVQIPVAQVVRVGFGSGCYLSREGVQRFFRIPYRPNSLILTAQEGQLPRVKEQMNRLRGVAFAVESEKMLDSSRELMAITVVMIDLLAGFSLVAGVIMIYNIINISMRERRNEFGTLMVLGMRTGEITEIILFEQAINFVAGILLGMPFSKWLGTVVEYAVGTDTLSVAMRIRPVTYLGTFAVCAAATVISLYFVIRGVLHIQLTEVLKARD